MGIPRFYRWLSERYPLINENITAEQIPEFDNLYLDMNGIIHTCSHNNTGGLCVKEESDVFVEVFNYIVRLCHLIKPRRLLYLAVDGCAPRAKMNQQRSRRFRASNDAREAREKAEEVGEEIGGIPFDSNSITPGTEFMGRLTEHLRFFVLKRIQEDPLWQGLDIVLSGPDVPGEGEHKIMGYIRSAKAQPGYSPNLRHCLYGLDADLIMLALVSHEPHFALLREEVIFGQRVTKPPEQRLLAMQDRFQLLHISLLREYLELEFAPALEPGSFKLERLIDDFVLFCVLVGNDFLPCLPFAEIGEGGLDAMFAVYKQHLEAASSTSPWLTGNCGQVQFEQLATFLQLYAEWERKQLAAAVESGWALGKRRSLGPGTTPDLAQDAPDLPTSPEEAREQYYDVKFGMEPDTAEQQRLFHAYLEGMQWVLFYYFRGPEQASWSWYYRYYHAPMATDLATYERLAAPGLCFETGGPFQPFQQLMAVLPAMSKALLPRCYQWLFDAPESPIAHFYPPTFELDLDGVKVPWGGVALIPWIEPSALLEAMDEAERRGPPLSKEEQRRNELGRACCFRHDCGQGVRVPSTMPQRFAGLEQCPVRMRDFAHPALPVGVAHFPNELLPGCNARGLCLPSLALHALTSSPGSGIKVFQQKARGESLIVHLHPEGPLVPTDRAITKLLKQQTASIDYPIVHRGKVVAVHTAHTTFFADGRKLHNNAAEHENRVWNITREWRRRGLVLDFEGTTEEQSWQQPLAEVMVVDSLDAQGQPRFKAGVEHRLLHLVGQVEEAAAAPQTPVDRFPVGAAVLCIDQASECFGQLGYVEVTASKEPASLQASFRLGLTREEQGELQSELQQIVARQHSTLKWWELGEAARQVGLDVHVTRLAFTSVMARGANGVREDLGMNLMCETWDESGGNQHLCLPTYSIRKDGTWLFSDLAVEALVDYRRQFPKLFAMMRERKPRDRDLDMRLAFPDSPDPDHAAAKLVKYCTSQPFKKLRLVPEHHAALAAPAVTEVVQAVDRAYSRLTAKPERREQVLGSQRVHKPEDKLPPELARGTVELGQRGVFVRPQGPVQLGAKATVLGVYGVGEARVLELLLDSETFGATSLCSRAPALRGLQVPLDAFVPLPARPTLPRSRRANCKVEATDKVSGPRTFYPPCKGDNPWPKVFDNIFGLDNFPQGCTAR